MDDYRNNFFVEEIGVETAVKIRRGGEDEFIQFSSVLEKVDKITCYTLHYIRSDQ